MSGPMEAGFAYTLAFRFNHEESPVAVTGVEGEVVDLLLPSVGDLVFHRDVNGRPFTGKVTERLFEYDLRDGAFA